MSLPKEVALTDLHNRYFRGSLAELAWKAHVWGDSVEFMDIARRTLPAPQACVSVPRASELLSARRVDDSLLKTFVDDWLHYCGLIEIAVEVGYIEVGAPSDYWQWMRESVAGDFGDVTRATERPLPSGLRFRLWGEGGDVAYLRTGQVPEWMFAEFMWLSEEVRPGGTLSKLTGLFQTMSEHEGTELLERISQPVILSERLLESSIHNEGLSAKLKLVDRGLETALAIADLLYRASESSVLQAFMNYHWGYQLGLLSPWGEYLRRMVSALAVVRGSVEPDDVSQVDEHISRLREAVEICLAGARAFAVAAV